MLSIALQEGLIMTANPGSQMKLKLSIFLAGCIMIGMPGATIAAPQTDVTNYTYPTSVSYFYLFADDGGISSKLGTASGYLKSR